ncbi:Protein-glutamine gamma-glutamyltransferase 2 [Acipenser ruthenus]|uniref:Protein-glutamine gamma-glutamyltransferase 2 n=1 Tax=Acipenser ruthenus TaxID=7906 RepID=A0A444V600_ACIRT|nr:Protein-glutamine gamma-glutamyltransferase 2 [Acipenser ruthenus]
MLEHSDSYQITKGVQLNFVQETHAVSGKEIAVTLVIFNNSETPKSLTLNLNAQVMLYTGRPACQIWSRRVTTKIGPNTEKNVVVSSPELLLQVSGDPVQYQPMMAEVTFFNPLLEPLTDCTMSLTGSGLLFKTIDTCVGTLGPQLRVRLQIPFTPTKTGSRMLTVGFNSDQFCDIKAYTSVTINPPK